MQTIHRSCSMDHSLRWTVETASGRVRQVEQHLQTIRPMVRPGCMEANARAFHRRTRHGVSHHRQHGRSGSPVRCWRTREKGGQLSQALGRSRGGFSTKIHVSVDGLGNPLRFTLTAGHKHDITQAEKLICGYAGEYVIADKGYDSHRFIEHISDSGMVAVIPPRSNRKQPRSYDDHLYRERHLVECFIGKIKHYRRIFSRFDKLDSRYLGFLQLAAALIWLR